MNKQATIGRRDNKRSERNEITTALVALNNKQITLESGKVAVFRFRIIPYEEIEKTTFVNEDINGREQALISDESLSELQYFSDNQYYVAYGYRTSDGRIGITDGSRRRKIAIKTKRDLEIFVSDEEIDPSDLIIFAQRLQSAREHNMREEGRKFQAIINEKGIKQSEVAKILGKSTSHISRCINAHNLDVQLLLFYPDPGKITSTTYVALHKIVESLKTHDVAFKKYIKEATSILSSKNSYTQAEVLEIMQMVVSDMIGDQGEPEKPDNKVLREFNNKNRRAKRSIKGDVCKFELKGFTEKTYNQLEAEILAVLEKYE